MAAVYFSEFGDFVVFKVEVEDLPAVQVNFGAEDVLGAEPVADAVQKKARAGGDDDVLGPNEREHAAIQPLHVARPETVDQAQNLLAAPDEDLHVVVDRALQLFFAHEAELVADGVREDHRQVEQDFPVPADHVEGEVQRTLAPVKRIVKIEYFHSNLRQAAAFSAVPRASHSARPLPSQQLPVNLSPRCPHSSSL